MEKEIIFLKKIETGSEHRVLSPQGKLWPFLSAWLEMKIIISNFVAGIIMTLYIIFAIKSGFKGFWYVETR